MFHPLFIFLQGVGFIQGVFTQRIYAKRKSQALLKQNQAILLLAISIELPNRNGSVLFELKKLEPIQEIHWEIDLLKNHFCNMMTN